jgi:hypothetical protein
MVNLTFPSNPTNGQKVTVNDKVFVYNSTTSRWTATRLQVFGNLTDDFTIDAPSVGVSLSTVALDTTGANVYITYTVDQDVKASITTSGLGDTTATLHQTNNTIVVTAGATDFANGQIDLIVNNGRSTDTETINVSAVYTWAINLNNLTDDSVNLTLSSPYLAPYGLSFNNNGTIMVLYTIEGSNYLHQYSLSTPWNLATATLTQSVNVSSYYTGQGRGIQFNNDGTKIFFSVNFTNVLSEHNLSTPYDISTISSSASATTTLSGSGDIDAFTFNSDGTRLWHMKDPTNPDTIYESVLSTGFDLTTINTNHVRSTSDFYVGSIRDTRGLIFNPDGTKLYNMGYSGSAVYLKSGTMSTPFDITTLSGDGIEVTYNIGQGYSLYISDDGKKLYVATDNGSSTFVYQFSTGL